MIFGFIDAEKANKSYPVTVLCKTLGVSPQGYYAWRARQAAGPTARQISDGELLARIFEAYTAGRGTYGSPRVYRWLRDVGVKVSEKRVACLMAENGLVGRPGRAPIPRTTIADPDAAASPNLLNRDFTAAQPDEKWVTDITYLRTGDGFMFLAAIIDCCTRMVVGWSVAEHLRTELCLAALDDAVERRQPGPGLLHHSDRGCQYTSYEYRARLKALEMRQSMSRVGNCWDNAVAESFFSTLKLELVYTQDWESHDQLRLALFEYIEIFYNRERLHSTLDYSTPFEYDRQYLVGTKVA